MTREVFGLPDGTQPDSGSRAGTASTPAASPAARRGGRPFATGLVDRRPLRRRVRLLRTGLVPSLRHRASGTTPDNITYFVGSIFFTTASFLQYVEVASTPTDLVEPHRNGLASLLRIRHRRIDWWAAGIQLIGTCGSTGPR